MTEAAEDPGKMSFEAAMAALERVVSDLEAGKVPLEQSIALYERGAALKARCEKLLQEAEERVEKITLDAGGAPAGLEKVEGL
jgi:exodeoxyribonuclease VII small subunit